MMLKEVNGYFQMIKLGRNSTMIDPLLFVDWKDSGEPDYWNARIIARLFMLSALRETTCLCHQWPLSPIYQSIGNYQQVFYSKELKIDIIFKALPRWPSFISILIFPWHLRTLPSENAQILEINVTLTIINRIVAN